jgi:hypothetical protein
MLTLFSHFIGFSFSIWHINLFLLWKPGAVVTLFIACMAEMAAQLTVNGY